MGAVAFMTLGCKVNQFETETMEGLFRARGYEVVPFEERADVYVVNTCSVTHLSDRKSRQLIRRAARTNPRACIAVCGCYAQVAPEEIRALEGVRVVIGTKERAQIVDYVEEALRAEDRVAGHITDIMQARVFEDIPLAYMPHRTRAFLKIEDGCQNFCTFCIIPYARGPVKSRTLPAVRRETARLVRDAPRPPEPRRVHPVGEVIIRGRRKLVDPPTGDASGGIGHLLERVRGDDVLEACTQADNNQARIERA